MVTNVTSVTFNGINVVDVDVQIYISQGIPAFTIVGLADKTIAESKERVRAALSALGLGLPVKKILINLSPADLVKEGSHFDLAIACALLASINVLPNEISAYIILGELALDGSILPVSGALPAAIGANAKNKGLICPFLNGKEAAWSGNDNILAVNHLLDLVNHFKGVQVLTPPVAEIDNLEPNYLDLADIQDQKTAKRALEITAAGGHNMLMFGPPGAGKSMLALRMPGILPKMTSKEILESSMIASVSGLITNGKLTKIRPFRAPHHSCSLAAMVGGGIGRKVKPGEISLSHNGILFLDELPEFSPNVIESLRQPIETGEVLISRSGYHVKYPSRFQLIAAMNPCRCGYLLESDKACSRAPKCGQDYLMKISGPIMDRFDLHISVPSVELPNKNISNNETSATVANRVIAARNIQLERYDGYGIRTNSQLDGQMLIEYAMPYDEGVDLLNKSAAVFKLSMRGYNRILRVARTIADLEENKKVKKIHIAEALSYRQVDFFKNNF